MRTPFLATAILGTLLLGSCTSPDTSGPAEEAPGTAAYSPVVDVSAASEADWIRLFNREDLAGWTPKVRGFAAGEDPEGTFSVQNGAITAFGSAASGKHAGARSHLPGSIRLTHPWGDAPVAFQGVLQVRSPVRPDLVAPLSASTL